VTASSQRVPLKRFAMEAPNPTETFTAVPVGDIRLITSCDGMGWTMKVWILTQVTEAE